MNINSIYQVNGIQAVTPAKSVDAVQAKQESSQSNMELPQQKSQDSRGNTGQESWVGHYIADQGVVANTGTQSVNTADKNVLTATLSTSNNQTAEPSIANLNNGKSDTKQEAVQQNSNHMQFPGAIAGGGSNVRGNYLDILA